ncbi:MAG: hypothetical protein ACRDRN_17975, partial [Sciscionella sp.]
MSTPGPDREPYGEGAQSPMPPASDYNGPPAGYGPVQAHRNGFGITALVLGILAIVLCWTAIGGIILG